MDFVDGQVEGQTASCFGCFSVPGVWGCFGFWDGLKGPVASLEMIKGALCGRFLLKVELHGR